MIKKLFITIVALNYLLVTSGVVVNSHYCMNDFASVSLFDNTKDTCGRCGMEMHESNGCCRDEMRFVKMNDDHNQSGTIHFQLSFITKPSLFATDYLLAALQQASLHPHFLNHSPPLLSELDIYLQNNVFRI